MGVLIFVIPGSKCQQHFNARGKKYTINKYKCTYSMSALLNVSLFWDVDYNLVVEMHACNFMLNFKKCAHEYSILSWLLYFKSLMLYSVKTFQMTQFMYFNQWSYWSNFSIKHYSVFNYIIIWCIYRRNGYRYVDFIWYSEQKHCFNKSTRNQIQNNVHCLIGQ